MNRFMRLILLGRRPAAGSRVGAASARILRAEGGPIPALVGSSRTIEGRRRGNARYEYGQHFAAGSGHPGGTLSIIDIAAALYLNVLNQDPSNPTWPERDRVFWSAGHKAPALYVALGRAGYFPLDNVVFLRQLGSGFEGHPNCLKLRGVEELPLPSDGICAQCEFQSLELCAACRIEWGKGHSKLLLRLPRLPRQTCPSLTSLGVRFSDGDPDPIH